MKYIEVTQGKQTIVDDEDFNWLNQWKWCVTNKGYVLNGVLKKLLHRFILNVPCGKQVDHINGDKLDNRRENLRIC